MSLTLNSNQSLVTAADTVSVFQSLLQALDTPVSLSCWLLIEYKEWDQLVQKVCKPDNYTDAESFRKDSQAVNGLRKASFLQTSFDQLEAAKQKFEDAEKKCDEINKKFDNLLYGDGLGMLHAENPEIFVRLFRAQKLISRILGKVNLDLANFRFGPGVTSLVRRDVTPPKKYSREIHVTPELYSYWRDVTGPSWASRVTNVTLVAGSSIAFVPKDATVHRTIAIEPHLNVYAQLGIGSVLRNRLRPYVDLSTGQEVNRLFAKMAGQWSLSTIDLSSASDTIARSLVWFLLPEDWATLLDTCRSHRFTLDGVEREFAKFSSMGNGFTFELETIIFYALARACGSHRALTTVYGDDIICEATSFPELVELLEFCGFTVNRNKSFHRSAFYESCGRDYFDGIDVRSFFWKELKPSFGFKMVNDISRFSQCGDVRDSCYRSTHRFAISRLPREARDCKVPKHLGDVGIWTEWDDASPSLRRTPEGWCGFMTKAMKYRSQVQLHRGDFRGYLYSLDRGGVGSEASIRGRGVYQIGRTFAFGEWCGPGQWA